MLLAIDVGNTQTVLGLYDGDRLTEHWRLATEPHRTGDELGALFGRFLDLRALSGICLSSTVPRLVREYEELAERWTDAPLLVVGPGIRTGITLRYDSPREVGPDRIVNSIAACERYGAPVIVVDFGTSTNFDIVSAPIGAPFARRYDVRRSRAMKPAIEIETAAARTVLVLLDRRIHHAVTPRRRYSSHAGQASGPR